MPSTPPARTLLALLLIALAGPTPATSAPDHAPAEFYEDALGRYRSGAYSEAIIQAKNALQADPRHLPSRILLGQALLEDGQPAEAEQELTAALGMRADRALIDLPLAHSLLLQRKYRRLIDEIDPWRHQAELGTELFLLRGEAFLAQGDQEGAEWMFTEAARIATDRVEPLVGHARVRVAAGDLEKAARLTNEATARDPGHAGAWQVKAMVSHARGQPADALAFISRALDLAPDHLPARLDRAALLVDMNRAPEAQGDLDLLRERMPYEPMVPYLQSLVHARAGAREPATEALELARGLIHTVDNETLARHPPSLLLAGAVEHLLGNADAAAMYLGSYLSRYPRQTGVRKRLADIYLGQGRAGEALEALEPARLLGTADAQLWTLMGRAYLALQNPAKASELLQRAAALEPDDPEVQLHMAAAQLGSGHTEEASQTLERLFRQDLTLTRAGLLLGYAHIARGEPDKALQATREILAREPDNTAALSLMGTAQMLKGDLDVARTTLTQILDRSPDNLPVRLSMARLEMLDGHPQEALELIQQILRTQPEHIEALRARAELALQTEGVEQAIHWYEQLRRYHPREIAANLALIELHLQAQQPEKALDAAERLQTMYPDDIRVLRAVGRAEMANQRRELAQLTFRRMATLASYDADALYDIADLQLQTGDTGNAFWSLVKAVEGDPGHLPAQLRLGFMEVLDDKTDRALERALELQKDQPDLAWAYALEGDARTAMKELAAAERAYAKAAALADEPALVSRLYRARSRLGQSNQALEVLERWLVRHPEDLEIKALYGAGLIRAGREADARTVYEELLTLSPDHPDALNNLALIYLHSDDGRARATAEKAYALAPGDPYIADTLGWILVRTGDPSGGLHYLRLAQSRLSQTPAIRYHIATALSALGRKDEARRELEGILSGKEPFDDQEAARRLLEDVKRPG